MTEEERSPRHRFNLAIDEDAARRRLAAARFAVLAATILLTIAVIMLSAGAVFGRVGLQVLISFPLFVGLYVVSGSKRVVAVGVILMAAIAVLGLISAMNDEIVPLVLDIGLRAGVIAVLTGWLLVEIVRQVHISLDTILGGICVYLLLAYFYAHLYLMLEILAAGSLISGGRPLDAALGGGHHALGTIADLLYFSYATLTTVAYGDIAPATSLARFVAMTEGMIGQLFPTIFIARLVSLNVAQMGLNSKR